MSDELVKRLRAQNSITATQAADRIEALEAELAEAKGDASSLAWAGDRVKALEAENARLTDAAAQAHSLFDLCWNAIQTAVANEDGLDGAVGETLMTEIRVWQDKNSDAIRALAESEKPQDKTDGDVLGGEQM